MAGFGLRTIDKYMA